MSAFLVSKAHLDYLVCAALTYHGVGGAAVHAKLADEIGQLWLDANEVSLGVRYGDPVGTEPRYVYVPPAGARVDPVQVLKAARCLAYQSCEYGDWDASEAKAVLDAVSALALAALPARDRELVPSRYENEGPVARVFQSQSYQDAAWEVR